METTGAGIPGPMDLIPRHYFFYTNAMNEPFPLKTVADTLAYFGQNMGALGPELQLLLWALIGCMILEVLLPDQSKRLTGYAALGGIAFASFHLYKIYVNGFLGVFFNETTVIDPFSIFFKALFLAAALLTVLLSLRFMEIENEQSGEYYALILLATIGMMVMVSAIDLLTIYIGLELMAMSFYILVGYLRRNRLSNEASLKIFLLGAFASGILLYGFSLLYGLTGSTQLSVLARQLAAAPAQNREMIFLAVVLVIVGLGFKIAAVPFHMWAPDAYQGAPTPITAFLSVGSKAAAFTVMLRLFLGSFVSVKGWFLVLGVVALMTFVVGNLAALLQTNVKRLLAYSSISHAAYILLGLLAGREFGGIAASSGYLLIYTFMNFGAFAVLILMRRKGIPGDQIADFNGLIFRHPVIASLMLIFLLSLAGIPPTAGFIAKYMVFAAIIKAYMAQPSAMLLTLAIAGAVAAVVALYYYFLIVKAMFTGESQAEDLPALSFSPGVTAAIVITAGMTMWVGIFPDTIMRMAAYAASNWGAW